MASMITHKYETNKFILQSKNMVKLIDVKMVNMFCAVSEDGRHVPRSPCNARSSAEPS